MASRGDSKRRRLAAILSASHIGFIDEATWNSLAEQLAPISQTYLRTLIRDSGVALAPMVEGVRQNDFGELERTLIALQQAYEAAQGPEKRRIRDTVITAKVHARWSLQGKGSTSEAAVDKQEMILWMLTWLENPALFPHWLTIRQRALR